MTAWSSKRWVWLSYGAIGLVALALRVWHLGTFVTIDEVKFWLPRSERFLQALQSGDPAGMPLVGHPGVTTMWLGSVGIALRRFLFESGILTHETYATLLALHRLPAVLVHVAAILVGYRMLRLLLPAAMAFLAAWLWATDPFVVAFSRVLHVDALAGTFATLSLLAACVYASFIAHHSSLRKRWLVLSGICAALAVLSKLPALAVVPVVVTLIVGEAVRRQGKERNAESAVSFIIPRSSFLAPLLLWSGAFALTVVLLWPAIWHDPQQVYQAVRFGVVSEGGQPHMWGNYFLGRFVDVPGASFYAVALVLRMTPWTLAGVLLVGYRVLGIGGQGENPLGAQASRRLRGGQDARVPRIQPTLEWRTLATMAAFTLVFLIGMSLFPKKMNRYLVPMFPAVDILAAAGLTLAAAYKAQSAKRKAVVVSLVALVSLLNTAWFLPYNVAYFNQALGGARAGAATFLAGWGEGFDQVAAWLNQQPDITSVVTVTSLPSLLNPYLKQGAYASSDTRDGLPGRSGYMVVYLSQAQRKLSPPYQHYHATRPPLHTVTLHGVDYAWTYHLPREMPHPLRGRFGAALHVEGYALDTNSIRSSGVMTLTLQWQARDALPDDYHLFAHVLNADGERVGQVDVPLTDPHQPTSAWQPGRYILWIHPLLVPPDLPTGCYWVALGVYRPDDFSRLPLATPEEPPKDAPDDGAHVLFLQPVTLE